MPSTALPPQVSPPEFALSPALPHQIGGAEVWAFPVLPDEDGPLLGPGADEAGDALGVDLLAALEASRATGRTGELTAVPVAGSPARTRRPTGRPTAPASCCSSVSARPPRPTCAAPARRWPAPPRTAATS